jgi:hypothetical protein
MTESTECRHDVEPPYRITELCSEHRLTDKDGPAGGSRADDRLTPET